MISRILVFLIAIQLVHAATLACHLNRDDGGVGLPCDDEFRRTVIHLNRLTCANKLDTFSFPASCDLYSQLVYNALASYQNASFLNIVCSCAITIPTSAPTSMMPTGSPTETPSETPSKTPSKTPSETPSKTPSHTPSSHPTTSRPSHTPSNEPSKTPTDGPTTPDPTTSPTKHPSSAPVISSPTTSPSRTPSQGPTTSKPSSTPSQTPSRSPSGTPTTSRPSGSPTTSRPSGIPTTSRPSTTPSLTPSRSPSVTPTTSRPSGSPTTSNPSTTPSLTPSRSPSGTPTTSRPSTSPTTSRPSGSPTTSRPSTSPTTSRPSGTPSKTPSNAPSGTPTTSRPSTSPTTSRPSTSPTTSRPSGTPSKTPSNAPSGTPTTSRPSTSPTTSRPSRTPSWSPTTSPTLTRFVQQGDFLLGSGYSGTTINQGYSVATSGDGSTIAIGGYGDNSLIGAVWIFVYSNGQWIQQGNKLVTSSYTTSPRQGISVSLSYDGNTLAVGGTADNAFHGLAWVWTRTDGVWTQQGSALYPSDTNGTLIQFGSSVSLSSDGNVLAIGGQGDASNVGATWIFIRSGTTWIQYKTKLVGTGYVPNPSFHSVNQGKSVALSGDATTLAVGGYEDNPAGAVWIFANISGNWTQVGSKLVGTGYVNDSTMGSSIALSQDGRTLAFSGPLDTSGTGAVWIFVYNGTSWNQQGPKLVGTGGTSQGSVSLSADGNILAVGGQNDASSRGSLWSWVRSDGVWTQQGSKFFGAGYIGTTISEGCSVSLSANGSVLAAGGYRNNNSIGGTWVFLDQGQLPTAMPTGSPSTSPTTSRPSANPSQAPTTSRPSTSPTTSRPSNSPTLRPTLSPVLTNAPTTANFVEEGFTTVSSAPTSSGIGGSVAISPDGKWLVAGGASTYVYNRTDSGGWNLQATIPSTGTSVALNYDGTVLLIGYSCFNTNVGQMCPYQRTGYTWAAQTACFTSGVTGQSFAQRVALSRNGTLAVIGAGGNCGTQSSTGAYLYSYSGGTWNKIQTLITGASNGFCGQCVAMSADMNTLAVGCTQGQTGNGASSVTIYANQGLSGYTTQATLLAPGAVGNNAAGKSCALSDDGNLVVYGGQADNGGIGAFWTQKRVGTTWNLVGSKVVSPGSHNFGISISMSGDNILVGAPATSPGAAYLYHYRNSSISPILSQTLVCSTLSGTNNNIGQWVWIQGNIAVEGMPGDGSGKGGFCTFTSPTTSSPTTP